MKITVNVRRDDDDGYDAIDNDNDEGHGEVDDDSNGDIIYNGDDQYEILLQVCTVDDSSGKP